MNSKCSLNFCFVNWKFVYIFNFLVKSCHLRGLFHFLNKSFGLDRKSFFCSLALWQRYWKARWRVCLKSIFSSLSNWRRYQLICLTSGGFVTAISMMFGMNLGRWQQMKTPTMVIDIRVNLKKHYLITIWKLTA